MKKAAGIVLCGIAVVLLTAAAASKSKQASYADDRAAIEDLQGRYLFALDFHDADTYASTFTEDGVLDYGPQVKGREAIKKVVADMAKRFADQAAAAAAAAKNEPATPDAPAMWAPVGRHNISNVVIKVDGDKAVGRAYWFHYSNNTPKRTGQLDSFGHYEDEMVKVNGQWLFSKRKIYNEQVKDWIYTGANPAW